MIGHCEITHKFIFNRNPRPICNSCDTALTVEHIILHCTSYLNRNFSNRNLNTVLGHNNSYQLNKLFEFLKTNNLYKTI